MCTYTGIQPEDVEEVYMGAVIQAMMGQSPARQALIYAGRHSLTLFHSSKLQLFT